MVTYLRLGISLCESREPTKILVGNRHVENLRPQSEGAPFSLVLVGGGSLQQIRLNVTGTHPFQAEDGIGRESGKVLEKFRKVRRRYFPTRRPNYLWQFGSGFHQLRHFSRSSTGSRPKARRSHAQVANPSASRFEWRSPTTHFSERAILLPVYRNQPLQQSPQSPRLQLR